MIKYFFHHVQAKDFKTETSKKLGKQESYSILCKALLRLLTCKLEHNIRYLLSSTSSTMLSTTELVPESVKFPINILTDWIWLTRPLCNEVSAQNAVKRISLHETDKINQHLIQPIKSHDPLNEVGRSHAAMHWALRGCNYSLWQLPHVTNFNTT